ncbi:uncharacterized protein C18orf63-like isoform X1 [Macrosteles quadrilineatus]|uniref:uncharacterized protein C18orf63-like isoform X1 n=1 Tax=Macrosteles quadrilineatus TaxID=74068 RepID=UPI0023E0A9B8|nr:uncharacterized protein C18orf63-like isoform X1 [Macrosteles quadrilineatus]
MDQFGDEDLRSILFGTIPKHEDLIYLLGTINFSDNNAASISNKAYQCQIFKCRCLIFTVPDVISSPMLGAVENIHIIISKSYYKSGKLVPHLERMNIEVTEPLPLTNAVYEACLRYTILARLAPSWNQVEKYLVRGRDFLLSASPSDAVKLDIVINEVDMHIVLWPLRVRLPLLAPQDLQATSSHPFSWDLSANNKTVHVLPSLNKANVEMVSSSIPQNSLFKSYKDLKRHWKNSYGYRLPDSEEGVVYVTVKFGRWFSESLTYPIMCVRARRPVFLRQREPERVLLQILADLHSKVPTICGYPFAIDAKVRYAMPKLNVLSEILYPSNLTEVKPERKKEYIEEDNPEANQNVSMCGQPVTHYSQPVSQYSQPVSQYSQLISQTLMSRPRSQAENKVPIRSQSPPPFLPRLSQLLPPAPVKPVFVPKFTSRTKPTTSTSTSTHTSSASPPHAPTMFCGTPMKPVFGLARSSTKLHSDAPLLFELLKKKNTSAQPSFGSPKTNPMSRPKKVKTLLNFPDNTNKKSRSRPQLQLDVDVKELAQKKGGLDKVNTTTLIAYLREVGVHCKIKDKKSDLVNKVLAHLHLLPETPASATHTSSQEM